MTLSKADPQIPANQPLLPQVSQAPSLTETWTERLCHTMGFSSYHPLTRARQLF